MDEFEEKDKYFPENVSLTNQ